ncbi:MAG: AAA family ATPase [Planctomycetota bacterium]
MNQATQTAEADAPVIVRLDEVTPRKVLWLWHHRIPCGKLTLLAGDGGIGKSLLTMDLAQRVSSGRPWPDSLGESNPAGGVVIVSAEDDVDDTIVPRLKAAGAELSRIVALQGVEFTDENRKRRGVRGFNLQHDLPVLQETIQTTDDCSLVIIDPATAYMGNVRGNDNVEVRGCLAPLAALAADTGVAVVLVTHFNKPGAASNATAAHRIIGSIAFNAAARATWIVVRDEEPSQRRLLLPVKWNLCREPTGLAYEIQPYDHDAEIPVLHWQAGAVTVRADDALSATQPKTKRLRDDVMGWIADRLAGGPVLSATMEAEIERRDFNDRTVDRAKRELGVVSRRLPLNGRSEWHWVKT